MLERPPLTIGPWLPIWNECFYQCLFFFNILGNNDPSSVVLMVLAENLKIRNFTEILILPQSHNNKNQMIEYVNDENEWENEFPNHQKFVFPLQTHFARFGYDFMVKCVVF